MKAMAAKQPSHDFHRQHQEVIQAPLIQNEIPSTDAIVLQRMSACPCDGGCPLCVEGMVIQPKLKIGEPGDRYEQEADRVADKVMRMPDPQSVTQSANEHSLQQLYPMCGEEKGLLQSKPISKLITQLAQRQTEDKGEKVDILKNNKTIGHNTTIAPDFESEINTIKGGGHPLPESIRAFFEPRFKYDFSQVRVHADRNAAEVAKSVNSRAFTLRQDIVFGTGQYIPETETGQRLLAHELTHVVQQSGNVTNSNISRVSNLRIQRVGNCAPGECRLGAHHHNDPEICRTPGRQCLGCIIPDMEPYQGTRDYSRRRYEISLCPDSIALASDPMLVDPDADVGIRDVTLEMVCQDICRSGGARVFGFASPESAALSYRNDYLAAHRAIVSAHELQIGCSGFVPGCHLAEGSIQPFLERTRLGLGVTDEFSPNEDNRLVWIEIVPQNETELEPSQPDEWACHPIGYSTGEVEGVTILPVGSGFFIEMHVVTLAHRPRGGSPQCRDFRYVGAGSQISLDDFLTSVRSWISFLIRILFLTQLPRQIRTEIEVLIERLINELGMDVRDFVITHLGGRSMSTSEWDCYSFRTPLRWDDWQTTGSHQLGPVYNFDGPGGLLRSVPFIFSGLDLPGVGGSEGIHQVPGGPELISVAPYWAILLRSLYRQIPPSLIEHMERDGIPRETIEGIVTFFEDLERWTRIPYQINDWTQLRPSRSCDPLRPLDCPLFETSRLGGR